MKKDGLTMLAYWLTVLGALLLGYESLTGSNLLAGLGSLSSLIGDLIGLAGLYVGYMMLGMKKK